MQFTNRPIVEFRNVSKYYQTGSARVTALDTVNLEVDRGDFVTVVGLGGGRDRLLHPDFRDQQTIVR